LVPTGILSFTCNAGMNGSISPASSLWYNISGTDAASFGLANSAVAASGFTARGDAIANAVVFVG